ncbi:MAG: hypothetical protein ABI604_19095, partial [Nitrospirota bacterium]
SRLLLPLTVQFLIVTFVFAMLDRNKVALLGKWDPRKLPAVRETEQDGPTAKNISHFLANAIGTLWLALTPNWPFLMLGPGAQHLPTITVMPEWRLFYWAIVGLLCAQLALQFVNLFRLLTRRYARAMDLILKSIGLCITFALLAKAPHYVSTSNENLTEWANSSLLTSLIVSLLIQSWGARRVVQSLWRNPRSPVPASQA